MALDDLLVICPPPATPEFIPTAAQWAELEKLVGHVLPSDYKAFLARYGTGGFGSYEDPTSFFDLVKVVSPGYPADRRGLNAIPFMMELTKTIGDIRREFAHRVPVPAWPEPGGLLFVGGTTTLHSIYWRTVGDDADAWTCDVCDYGCDKWFHWDGDLTSLLAAIATKGVPDWIIEGPTKFPLVFVRLDLPPGVDFV
jgi:hypothetical protein